MNKTIFITGGTGTVGTELIKTFLKNDYIVITTSRTKENISKLLKEEKNENLYGIVVDLYAENAVKTILTYLKENSVFPSILINNARDKHNLLIKDNLAVEEKKWVKEYILNVVVPYKLTTAFAKDKKIPLKTVINITSIYGVIAQNPKLYESPAISLLPHYGASKAAQIQLTKDLAVQLADENITVNSVSYGGIKTNNSVSFLKRYSNLVPLGRMMNITEISGIVLLLISDRSRYTTGQNFIVDGGFTAW